MDSLKKDNHSLGGDHKRVASTPEYLHKLFIMPNSADRFVEFGEHLLDMIHDFFEDQGGIHSAISIEDLQLKFSHTSLPDQPMLIKDVLDDIKNNIINHSVKVASPYYIGHMTTAIPYFMVLLEMISVSLNQNQVKIESAKASTFVEREFLSWMHRLAFCRSEDFYRRNIHNHNIALGTITSDGTIANLTGLGLALAKAFPPDGRRFKGIRYEGLFRAFEHYGYSRAVILVSQRGHYSIRKAGRLLGLGEDAVVTVPVVPHVNKIDIEKLYQTIDRIKREDRLNGRRTKFIAVVGVAGTTETGNIDDLCALRRVADELGAHYHVDAAWGGGALLMEKGRKMLSGIELADSVTIDAHKLLFAPNTMGICLFRDPRDSKFLYHTSNYIIREGSVDQGRFTIEGSRPFAAMKPWAAFKIIGRDGYRIIFSHAMTLMNAFIELLNLDPLFELLNSPELFIINYRFIPQELGDKLRHYMFDPEGNAAKIAQLNEQLNELNIELHKTIREHDTSFVSRTILESTAYAPTKIVVLRAITINPNTEPRMLEEILEDHRLMGVKLWQKHRRNFLR